MLKLGTWLESLLLERLLVHPGTQGPVREGPGHGRTLGRTDAPLANWPDNSPRNNKAIGVSVQVVPPCNMGRMHYLGLSASWVPAAGTSKTYIEGWQCLEVKLAILA